MAQSASRSWQPTQASAGANEPLVSRLPPHESRASAGFFSSLEGLGASLPWMSRKPSNSKTDPNSSQYTLAGCSHGWKPHTMRKRVLVPIAIWTAALTAVIEFLAQKSHREGGLALSEKPDNLSDSAEFCYKILPTIIAVIFSIAWTWVDLDVKRIQPWIELSKKGGAAVKDSLVLDYPYDFVAWVPFKAGKRRHWTVFLSGTIMVIIFWVITPLQGAIFGNASVQLSRPVSFHPSSQLLPIQEQSPAIDTSILHHLYATQWLDQSYPPFTTPEYAVQPFNLSAAPTTGIMNLTTTTTKVWTDLKCWPAELVLHSPKSPGHYDYLNGQGCNVTDLVTIRGSEPIPRKLQYIGWHNSAHADQFLAGPRCGKEFAHQFLAVMAKGDHENHEVTALFCEPSYWKQLVEVRLPSDTYRPQNASVTPVGSVEELSLTEFNSTAFEYMLGASVPEDQEIVRDYPNNLIVDQLDRVNGTGLDWPLSALVAFAVGVADRPVDDFLDEEVLAESFRSVHKSAFVLAYSSLLSKSTADTSTEGTTEFVLHGIKVSRPISAAVEGLLLAVGICCIILAIIATRMNSNLTADPATLGDLLTVLQDSPDLVEAATRKDNAPKTEQQTPCVKPRLQLRCGCTSSSGSMSVHVTGTPTPTCIPLVAKKDSKQDKQISEFEPARPMVFRKVSGILFVVALAASLAVLLFLKQQELRLGGIPRPTDSFEVLQLLENYIPTTIATLIEPYWVLVSRMLCIFQPFHDLWKGKGGAKARRAVDAKYTAIPPQLSIWGALRAGHIILVAVGVMALLGNVLAVGLGGLFDEKPIKATYPTDLAHLKSHQFDIDFMQRSSNNNGRQNDVFTAMKSNLTMGTPLQPWVTEEYYFQPFSSQSPPVDNSTEWYRGRTRGYGLEITCHPGPTTLLDPTEDDADSYHVDISDLKDSYGQINKTNCEDTFQIGDAPLNGTSTIEGAFPLCNLSFLLVYWARARRDPGLTIEFESHACFPKFQTATFDVLVDSVGRILSYERAGDFENDLGYDKSDKHTARLLQETIYILGSSSSKWHDDKKSQSWFADILKVMAGDRILDPAKPMPEGEEMIRMTENIWRRAFASFLGSDVIRYAAVAADEAPIAGERSVTETRIFMSQGAYIVSIAILALYILVAAVLYASSTEFILPRMPTTLAALLEFTGQSRALQEYTASPETKERLRVGRYIGRDGERHVGIEFAEFIEPEEALRKRAVIRNLGIRRRREAS